MEHILVPLFVDNFILKKRKRKKQLLIPDQEYNILQVYANVLSIWFDIFLHIKYSIEI